MEIQGKRDFGSFHVSNVQDLINLPEEEYLHPNIPVSVPNFEHYSNGKFEFGRQCRKKHFYLEDECTFLNHGAFGGTLKEALQTAQAWQIYVERQPLRFFDRELLPLLAHVTRRAAKFVGCEARDLILVPNVTTAVNCVVRSQKLQPKDVVLSLSIEYGAVKKIIKQICLETGATWREQELLLPLTGKEQIIKALEEGLTDDVKLVVLDHIPSNTPFIMPVKEVIQICHKRNIKILVDGAHALGSIDLHLDNLGADYYTTNAHKWLCSAKGVALMYVKRCHQATTRPLVISHGFGSGFNSEYIWSGLRDYSPFLALLTVLDFWEAIGPDCIRAYMYDLTRQAGKLLTGKWNTKLLAPADMFGSMTEVELPAALYEECGEVNYGKAEVIQNALYRHFNIEIPVKSVRGKLYVRVSAHIYNELSEYKKLADAVLQLQKEGELFKSNV